MEPWRARALAGIELGLKAEACEPLAADLDAAKRHIGELSMENGLLRERARAAERRLPLATRRSSHTNPTSLNAGGMRRCSGAIPWYTLWEEERYARDETAC